MFPLYKVNVGCTWANKLNLLEVNVKLVLFAMLCAVVNVILVGELIADICGVPLTPVPLTV